MALPGNLELHVWAEIIAGIFAILSVITSLIIIILHFVHYTEPTIQRYMIRIVFMIPVYAVSSAASLMWKEHAFYFTLARDCYESYVLYMFFRLMIELSEGEEVLVQKLEMVQQMRCSFPLCCWHIKPGRIFLHRCKQMILQFVVVKPILSILIFIVSILGVYDEGSFAPDKAYLYITIIYNVSFTLALYFLFEFYEAAKNILKPFRPLEKFLCIKAVIFFSYWQSIVIAILVHFHVWIHDADDWSISDVATGLQNFLICVEMFPLAIAHAKSFGWNSFSAANRHQLLYTPSVMQRIIDAANVTDVVFETFIALKRGPKRRVVVGDFLTIPKEEQLKRVVKSGWLSKRGEDLAKIWKTRFCVIINQPKGLVYFKKDIYGEKDYDFGNLKARGFIDFSEVSSVKPHKKTKNLGRFTVKTDARRWHFRAADAKEQQEWIDHIQEVLNTIPPKLYDVDINLEDENTPTEANETTVNHNHSYGRDSYDHPADHHVELEDL
eukprot:TRINITY_DN5975_c0_g1_i1.p1 TRINITY_DN5975_c0_g1~~TRINITY_DN5975_c0_g1_i1.p1  ORF type:complete len:496 (-),score=113.76 TRINITY_DN5975_c0_g1_i1:82-1569(-)